MDHASTSSASMRAGAHAIALLSAVLGFCASCQADPRSTDVPTTDPFLWLEDVEGEAALKWVAAQNERTVEQLTHDPRFKNNYEASLSVSQDQGRISVGSSGADFVREGWVYNLWQDEEHPRGVWRRAPLNAFQASSTDWQTLLDLDELGRREHRNWSIYGEPICLPQSTRCMLALADGGLDARIWREFDLGSREFVPGGFAVPEALSLVEWQDADTLLVVTNRDTDALTVSGFGSAVKAWARGTPFAAAKEILRAPREGLGLAFSAYTDGRTRCRWVIAMTQLTRDHALFWLEQSRGRFVPMSLPTSAQPPVVHDGELVFSISADWVLNGRTWKRGSILSMPVAQSTLPNPAVSLLKTVGARESIWDLSASATGVLLITYVEVRGRLSGFVRRDGRWIEVPLPLPDYGTVRRLMVGGDTDTAFMSYESFLQPRTLYAVDVAKREVTAIRTAPSLFRSDRHVSEQFAAISRDGTAVPYFVVRPRDHEPGTAVPTLLDGYGASGLTRFPTYSATLGRLWLDRGGAYVLANIRGGGEFGPEWFTSTLKENRQRVYDDFYAVAEDLVRRGITDAKHLGIEGFSSGGLLAGVAITQRPELFSAAVIQVGVLDLLRYHKLHVGAGFVWEWGSPDIPAERAFLERTSPYHNLTKRSDFPKPFLLTSTKDDRVHPGHSRKFAAKLESLHMPFLLYESREGGHFLSSTPQERAMIDALIFTYLQQQLMP
jgi:prolyl oligopeptidase